MGLTIQKIASGSVKLIIESSEEGFWRIESLYRRGELPDLLGLDVLEVKMNDGDILSGLLSEARLGKPEALSQLFELLIRELRQVASGLLRQEGEDHILRTTTLVNQLSVQVRQEEPGEWRTVEDFLSHMCSLMRQILVDYTVGARERAGDRGMTSINETGQLVDENNGYDIIKFVEVIKSFDEIDPVSARVTEMKVYFSRWLSIEELSRLLKMSAEKMDEYWKSAGPWIEAEMNA